MEIDRGAKLLGNPWKAVRTEVTFCCDGTKRKKSKDGCFPGALGAGGGEGETGAWGRAVVAVVGGDGEGPDCPFP